MYGYMFEHTYTHIRMYVSVWVCVCIHTQTKTDTSITWAEYGLITLISSGATPKP